MFLKLSLLVFTLLFFPNFSKSHQDQPVTTGYGGHTASSADNRKYHEHSPCQELPYGAGGHSSKGCVGKGQAFMVDEKIHTIHEEPGTNGLCRTCFRVVHEGDHCPVGSRLVVRSVQSLFGNIKIDWPETSNSGAETIVHAAPAGATETQAYPIKVWCGKINEMRNSISVDDHGPNWFRGNPFNLLTRDAEYDDDGPAPGEDIRMCSLIIPKTLRDDDTPILPKARFGEDKTYCGVRGGNHFRIVASCRESSDPDDKEKECKKIIKDFIDGTITLEPYKTVELCGNCCGGAGPGGSVSANCNPAAAADCKTWNSALFSFRCWAPLYDRRENQRLGDRDKGKTAYSSDHDQNINIIGQQKTLNVKYAPLLKILQGMQCLSNGMQQKQEVMCKCIHSGHEFKFTDKEREFCCPQYTTPSQDRSKCICNRGDYEFPITKVGDPIESDCTCPADGNPLGGTPRPSDGTCPCPLGILECGDPVCPPRLLSGDNAGCYAGAVKTEIRPENPNESVCTCNNLGKGVGTDGEGNCLRACEDTPRACPRGSRRITSGPYINRCAYVTQCASSAGTCSESTGESDSDTSIEDINANLPLDLPGRSSPSERCGASSRNRACVQFVYPTAGNCTCPTSGPWKISPVAGKCQASCQDAGTNAPSVNRCQCENSSYSYEHGRVCQNPDTDSPGCWDKEIRCECPDGNPRPSDGICRCPTGSIDKTMTMPENQCLSTVSCRKRCPNSGEVKSVNDPCPCRCPNGQDCTDPDGSGPAEADCCCADGTPCGTAPNQCPPTTPIKLSDPNRVDIVFGNSLLGNSFRSVYSLGRADQPNYICWECATGNGKNTNISDCSYEDPNPSQDTSRKKQTSLSDYVERQRRDLYCPLLGVCAKDGAGRCKCLNSEGKIKKNSYCEYANKDPFRRRSVSGETFDIGNETTRQGQRLQTESIRTMTVIPPN